MSDEESLAEMLDAERARANAKLHAALDALEIERDRRERAELRLSEIEASRAWRFWSGVRRLTGRERGGSPDER